MSSTFACNFFMKKYFLLPAFAFTLIVYACKKQWRRRFSCIGSHKIFYCFKKIKNFDEAKKYATKDSQGMLDLLNSLGKDSKEPPEENGAFEINNEKIEGENATVDVVSGAQNMPVTFSLKKEDDGWKVAFDKNSLMRTGINAAEKSGNDINDNADSLKRAMDSLPRVIDSMRESLQKVGTALDSASKELKKLNP